jgi:hypothetical protein
MSQQQNDKQPAKTSAPDAIMLLSSHCAHCPGVLDALAKLIKNGDIGTLNVINLEQHPEAMQHYKVRSVPWVRIGKHELTGAQTPEALKQRVEWALKDQQTDGNNQLADFDFLLSDGQVNQVVEAIKKNPDAMQTIMALLGDPGTILSTRIGIGVVFEELADFNLPLLQSLIPDLAKLTQHEDPRIRADAYHYLGMSHDQRAIPILEAGKKDKDAEVREIVIDSLENL